MKVLLVRLARRHFEMNFTHPLGLMSIASVLRSRGGHEVRIIDDRIEGMRIDGLAQETARYRPDLIGITGMTMEAGEICAYARATQEVAPDAAVVAGGVHATLFSERTLRETSVDFVVRGEGEESILELLEALSGGEERMGVAGTAHLEDGLYVEAPARPFIKDLDSLPFPAWDLIPVEKYFGKPAGDLVVDRPKFMTIFTSRACPYQCIYCHRMFGRGFRARRPDNVIAEIETLVSRFGIEEIHIQDDIFNLDLARAKEICRGIMRWGLDLVLVFPNGLRADRVDDELLDLLYRAGARRIAYAVETASPRLQRYIRKDLDLERTVKVMERTAEMGILTKGFFMLGFPGETREEIRATIDFAAGSACHVANFSRVLPYPGTELFEARAVSSSMEDIDYGQFTYDYSMINLSDLDDADFERMIRTAYRTFFLKPGRLARLVRIFPGSLRIVTFYLPLFLIKLFAKKKPGRGGREWGLRYH